MKKDLLDDLLIDDVFKDKYQHNLNAKKINKVYEQNKINNFIFNAIFDDGIFKSMATQNKIFTQYRACLFLLYFIGTFFLLNAIKPLSFDDHASIAISVSCCLLCGIVFDLLYSKTLILYFIRKKEINKIKRKTGVQQLVEMFLSSPNVPASKQYLNMMFLKEENKNKLCKLNNMLEKNGRLTYQELDRVLGLKSLENEKINNIIKHYLVDWQKENNENLGKGFKLNNALTFLMQ